MKPRMLCLDCGVTAHADTVLEGSDRVEILGWICLGLPGWLYCAWRHALRVKVCRACGSEVLMREARGAAAGEPAVEARPHVASRRGGVRWPAAVREPRLRLRRGGLLVLWWLAFGLAAGVAPAAASAALLRALVLLGAAGVGRGLATLLRERATLAACAAWDADGRPLRIELL